MRVPTLDGQRVQTRQVSTQSTEIDRRGLMEPLIRGTKAVAEGFNALEVAKQRTEEKARKEAAATRLDQADVKAAEAIRKLLHDKNTGYLNQQGANALDNEKVLGSVKDSLDEIAGELPPDLQSQFKLRAESRYGQAWESTERHTATERERLEAEVAESQKRIGLDEAASAEDEKDLDEILGRVVGTTPSGEPGPLRRYLIRQGASPERIKAEEDAYRASVYAEALEKRLAAKDWRAADSLFGKVKDQLGPHADKLEKSISTMRTDMEAERAALEAIEAARNPANGRVDTSKALDAVKAAPEGPTRDEVRQRIEHQVSVVEKQWKLEVEGRYSQAFTAYLNGGSLSAIDSRDKAWLIENAPEEWRKLQQMSRADAEHARQGRDGSGRAGGETEEQAEAWTELRVDMAENPEKYVEMTADGFNSEWGHRLSKSALRAGAVQLGGVKERARKAETEGRRVGESEFSKTIDASIKSSGIKDKKEIEKFKVKMYTWLSGWRAENGSKEPDRDAVNAAIADELLQGEVQGVFMNSTKRRFQLKEGEVFMNDADGAPPAANTRAGNIDLTQPTTPSKRVTKYLRSPDKTRRVPVYEDGTTGPEEMVP